MLPHLKMSARSRWTLAATILASSMTFIDATVVNVALPALQADLHATITDVQWVIEAYALFLGALILVGGSMGDQLGRKRVFLFGLIFFTAASILCGLAASSRVLIAGRALQGVGAAFLVPGSLAIISATFDDAERGRAIGTWSGFSAITTAIGPVSGGWLVEHVSWRAVFFLNAPLAIVVLALSFRFMEESRDPSRTGRIDWTGAAAAVLGLGGIVLGLIEWPPLGIRHPLVLAALAIGTVSLVWLLHLERHAPNPMLPLTLFRSRTFTLANALTLLLYAALGVTMFLMPMDLIQVQHYTATAAGAALLPLPLIMFALSRWSGGLVARIGSRLPLTIGPVIAAAG
ncbi:MAG TPA: MFS transporter, partial [Vicinamibacterales bacterium]